MIWDVVDGLQVRPRRRRWRDDVKAQIVADSCAPGAVVSEVARRHEISPQLLSTWRKAARDGLLKALGGAKPVERTPSGTGAIQDLNPSSGEKCRVVFGPGPGHQFVETRGRPEIDQLGEDIGQIGLRFDATELCCLDQRRNTGPILRALIMPCKQCVFSIQNKRTDASLDDIRVELDAAIVEELREPVPVVQGVPDIPGDRRLAGDAGELQFEPFLERQHERLAARLSDGAALIGAATSDHLLDGIEGGDARAATELRTLQLVQQVAQPVVLRQRLIAFGDRSVTLGDRSVTFGARRRDQRLQRLDIAQNLSP